MAITRGMVRNAANNGAAVPPGPPPAAPGPAPAPPGRPARAARAAARPAPPPPRTHLEHIDENVLVDPFSDLANYTDQAMMVLMSDTCMIRSWKLRVHLAARMLFKDEQTERAALMLWNTFSTAKKMAVALKSPNYNVHKLAYFTGQLNEYVLNADNIDALKKAYLRADFEGNLWGPLLASAGEQGANNIRLWAAVRQDVLGPPLDLGLIPPQQGNAGSSSSSSSSSQATQSSSSSSSSDDDDDPNGNAPVLQQVMPNPVAQPNAVAQPNPAHLMPNAQAQPGNAMPSSVSTARSPSNDRQMPGGQANIGNGGGAVANGSGAAPVPIAPNNHAGQGQVGNNNQNNPQIGGIVGNAGVVPAGGAVPAGVVDGSGAAPVSNNQAGHPININPSNPQIRGMVVNAGGAPAPAGVAVVGAGAAPVVNNQAGHPINAQPGGQASGNAGGAHAAEANSQDRNSAHSRESHESRSSDEAAYHNNSSLSFSDSPRPNSSPDPQQDHGAGGSEADDTNMHDGDEMGADDGMNMDADDMDLDLDNRDDFVDQEDNEGADADNEELDLISAPSTGRSPSVRTAVSPNGQASPHQQSSSETSVVTARCASVSVLSTARCVSSVSAQVHSNRPASIRSSQGSSSPDPATTSSGGQRSSSDQGSDISGYSDQPRVFSPDASSVSPPVRSIANRTRRHESSTPSPAPTSSGERRSSSDPASDISGSSLEPRVFSPDTPPVARPQAANAQPQRRQSQRVNGNQAQARPPMPTGGSSSSSAINSSFNTSAGSLTTYRNFFELREVSPINNSFTEWLNGAAASPTPSWTTERPPATGPNRRRRHSDGDDDPSTAEVPEHKRRRSF